MRPKGEQLTIAHKAGSLPQGPLLEEAWRNPLEGGGVQLSYHPPPEGLRPPLEGLLPPPEDSCLQ